MRITLIHSCAFVPLCFEVSLHCILSVRARYSVVSDWYFWLTVDVNGSLTWRRFVHNLGKGMAKNTEVCRTRSRAWHLPLSTFQLPQLDPHFERELFLDGEQDRMFDESARYTFHAAIGQLNVRRRGKVSGLSVGTYWQRLNIIAKDISVLCRCAFSLFSNDGTVLLRPCHRRAFLQRRIIPVGSR